MFDPKEFATAKAKPLPVYLLLDVSGSMGGVKINNLNEATDEMIRTMADEEKMEVEILISVITFGNDADVHLPATSASQVEWSNLNASGMTAMGAALIKAKEMIEDKEITPSRAYRPTIVLVSDGQPNDTGWERAMDDFINTGRSKKCDRMAMAIGSDADENVLKRFIDGTEHELFYANNAGDLHEFFRYVTMSVTTRSRSQNPNEIPADADLKSKVSDEPNLTDENSAESTTSNDVLSDDEW
jgi:uncharacterized protein YegL